MFSSLTFLLAGAVAAQAASPAASAATSSPTANPYIPSDISPTCQDYLQTLNSDPDLADCTSTLIGASSAFGPGGSAATGASKDTISSALSDICSSATTSSCPQSLITGKLASFYTECGPELTSKPSALVRIIYDTFYVLLPLLQSVCAKDDDANYCVFSADAGSSAAPDVASIASRDSEGVTAYMPNADTINSHNLVFLLLNGSMPEKQLCTSCTKSVLTNYITFEGKTNYAPGMAQSVLMSNQPSLYNSVVNTCGADFLTNAVQAAGGLGQGSTKGSSGALSLRAGAGGMLSTVIGALVVAAIVF